MSFLTVITLFALCIISQPQPAPLPSLNIDSKQISVSGLSSGADFAVQFHVAFSDVVMGAGVFAGEPYHCAVTHFEDDPPKIPYDHCKNHPNWVNTSLLADYAIEEEKLGNISPLKNLLDDFIYLYRGTKDHTYLPGSVAKTGEFYEIFLKSKTQVLFENTIPSLHCMPTVNYGTPCGTSGDPPGIEQCNYDGAGNCLSHIYQNTPLKPPQTALDDNLFEFDQKLYFGSIFPGFDDIGWIYIPPPCQPHSNPNPCKLHIFFHGCGSDFNTPGFNFTYIKHAGFNPWAESNDIVLLYPQMGGCWDSYGDTGEDYCLKTGVQMATIRRMIHVIAGV